MRCRTLFGLVPLRTASDPVAMQFIFKYSSDADQGDHDEHDDPRFQCAFPSSIPDYRVLARRAFGLRELPAPPAGGAGVPDCAAIIFIEAPDKREAFGALNAKLDGFEEPRRFVSAFPVAPGGLLI